MDINKNNNYENKIENIDLEDIGKFKVEYVKKIYSEGIVFLDYSNIVYYVAWNVEEENYSIINLCNHMVEYEAKTIEEINNKYEKKIYRIIDVEDITITINE